jgi:uncharacterized protein (TIGR02594 family)
MARLAEPSWLVNARKYIGLHESNGPQTNPQILKFLDEADGTAGDGKTLGGIRDDETPWCATFVSATLEECTIKSMRSAWARSYLKFGDELPGPAVGCVVVFERGPTSGHVGFVVGKDRNGNIMVLGGNQGDSVKVSPFPRSRVLSYRWPSDFELPAPDEIGMPNLPIVSSDGKVSTNEA